MQPDAVPHRSTQADADVVSDRSYLMLSGADEPSGLVLRLGPA